jgi:hypothetical protein
MTFEHITSIIGVIVPVLSAIASALNADVRKKQADSVPVPPALAKVSAIVNAGALNVDKAKQMLTLVKALKGSK